MDVMFESYRKYFILCFFPFLSGIFSQVCFAQSNLKNPSGFIPDFDSLPETAWVFNSYSSFFSSPVVSEKVVYIGGLDSIFYALDINSGKEVWKIRTNGGIRSNACISDTTIYLNGGDGMVYALNKKTGNEIWVFKTRGEKKYDFADYFHSSPVLENGLLLFGSGDGSFYAISSVTGRKLWEYKTGGIVHTTPVIANSRVFFGSFDGFVYALDLKDGNLLWKFKTVGHKYFPVGEVQGSPAVYKNLVFIGARDYNVYAIDQEKGYCHWNKSFIKGWGLSNTICDSVLFTGSADERVLIAANPETGHEYWRINMEFLVFGNNAYSRNMLYIGTTNGKLHGIDKKTGEIKWSFATESYKENRLKYFKPDDSYRDDIYSIIRSNEEFLEVECELGGIFSTPVISDGFLIFTSTNGKVYCLKSR